MPSSAKAVAVPRSEGNSAFLRNTSPSRRSGAPRDRQIPLDTALSGFSNVDSPYDDPRSLVNYLDKANSNEQVRFSKWQMIHRILHPNKGDHVLDLGCGLGHDTQAIARLFGRTGRVVGLDKSNVMIREAQRRSRDLNLSLEFLLGDAQHLVLDDERFHKCIAVGVFMHLERPTDGFSEVVRVLKPGGRLAVLEADWDTLVITGGNSLAGRTIVNILRQSVRHSGIGHELPTHFWQAGLENIQVEAATLIISNYSLANTAWRIDKNVERARRAGLVSNSQAKKLLQELALTDKAGLFLGTSTGFAVSGRKP